MRQKLNTKSSTEAELVGVDDVMPLILWTRQFLLAQGLPVRDNIVFQDNMSSMLLEQNGKISSGKRTRHLSIRYYFVTDRINNGELEVKYCPTEDMIGDFFTKPLQGNKLKKMRSVILNLDNDGNTVPDHGRIKECVEPTHANPNGSLSPGMDSTYDENDPIHDPGPNAQ